MVLLFLWQELRNVINTTYENYSSEPRPRGQFMDKKEDYASAEYYLKVAKILAEDEANATAVVGEVYGGYVKRVTAEKDRHTKIYLKLDNPHGATLSCCLPHEAAGYRHARLLSRVFGQ